MNSAVQIQSLDFKAKLTLERVEKEYFVKMKDLVEITRHQPHITLMEVIVLLRDAVKK